MQSYLVGYEWPIHLLQTISIISGGHEIFVLCLLTFFVGRRHKFFYYLTAFAINKMILDMLKLTLCYPRPFMVVEKINLSKCPSDFGSPSGHALYGAMLSVLVYLDLFHGIPVYFFLH